MGCREFSLVEMMFEELATLGVVVLTSVGLIVEPVLLNVGDTMLAGRPPVDPMNDVESLALAETLLVLAEKLLAWLVSVEITLLLL